MTIPKAILICSLLAIHLTKARVIIGWNREMVGDWYDRYLSMSSGLACSRRSEEVVWRHQPYVGAEAIRSLPSWGTADEVWLTLSREEHRGSENEGWLTLSCKEHRGSVIGRPSPSTRSTASAISIWPTLETKDLNVGLL